MTLLRTELGVLIDNLTRVYSVVKRKVAAKPNVTEEITNSKVNEETKEGEIKEDESTVLCKFVEDPITEVPDVVINPQLASKKQRDVFKELFYKQLNNKFCGKL